MTDIEYAKFIVEDTCVNLLHAVAIYAAALTAYWIFLG
jgi:hypothetical protein